MKPKILFVAHNHPAIRPGGGELYALELHEALAEAGQFEPILIAKGGPPLSSVGLGHAGTCFSPVRRNSDQYFMYTDGYVWDKLLGTFKRKDIYTTHFRQLLLTLQPDIVHFQHTLHLGYDMIREVRNTLPDAPIIYTLHEYLPICHRQGQMVRTVNNEERCKEETPRRCHECFPEISPQTFFLRRRFIQSQFDLVDLFLAPSEFLRQRYIDWGIAPERIRFMDYGRRTPGCITAAREERPRNRLGYFGQLTPFKGAHVLLEAMTRLAHETREQRLFRLAAGAAPEPSSLAHLWVHGANLEFQPRAYQEQFNEMLGRGRSVTWVGRYEHSELPRLLANIDWVVVPSIWWENSPLVIQEAFIHGRPVICSDIGGMAEKVAHGVNGLHFRAGDAANLEETIRYAVNTEALWDRLCRGIPPVYSMEQHIQDLSHVYRELLARKRSLPMSYAA